MGFEEKIGTCLWTQRLKDAFDTPMEMSEGRRGHRSDLR